ncbi:hypothetical protein [Paludisphaera sp.]|uniref:hypothetical protein n=1 Tax=Paludisphaera sp. TaxID=2017432 RepID=UPI00301E25AA
MAEADPRGEFDEADVEDSRQIYLRTWAAGFRALLGWPEEKTLEWAERWSDALRDPGMSFYHDQPEKWMTSALIPEWLMEEFRRDWWVNLDPGDHDYAHLRKRLIEAMVADPGQEFKFVEEYDDRDWAEARLRVRAVLQDFGADLPET